jgi:hypothetical protein
MDGYSFVRNFFLCGHLMRICIYVSSMWRYVVLFVVIGEEILCVTDAGYSVGSYLLVTVLLS